MDLHMMLYNIKKLPTILWWEDLVPRLVKYQI